MNINDYTQVYVTKCGEVCQTWREGKEHERYCDKCNPDEE